MSSEDHLKSAVEFVSNNRLSKNEISSFIIGENTASRYVLINVTPSAKSPWLIVVASSIMRGSLLQ